MIYWTNECDKYIISNCDFNTAQYSHTNDTTLISVEYMYVYIYIYI